MHRISNGLVSLSSRLHGGSFGYVITSTGRVFVGSPKKVPSSIAGGSGGEYGRRFLASVVSDPPLAPSTSSRRGYMAKAAQEPFLNGSSSVYVEEMYRAWLKDPNSVHKSWDAFFKSAAAGALPGQAYQSPPSPGSSLSFAPSSTGGAVPRSAEAVAATATPTQQVQQIDDHLSVQAIIRSYQTRGHLAAKLDPLSIVTQYTPTEAVLRNHKLGN